MEANVSCLQEAGNPADLSAAAGAPAAAMRSTCKAWRQALEVAPAALAPLVSWVLT